GELAIRLEKSWVMRNGLIQQIYSGQRIRLLFWKVKAECQKKILSAAIKMESGKISSWWALNGQFLSMRDFDVKLLCNLFCDFALDGKDVFQVAIVFLGPDMRIGARIDQLGVDVKPGSSLTYAAFEYMGDA